MEPNFNKTNIVIIYNASDQDSKEFAFYYANIYSLDYDEDENYIIENENWEINGQCIGINCSSIEILNSEDDFKNEILNPIKDALQDDDFEGMKVWGIVLGFKIPGGFKISNPSIYGLEEEKIISTTSALSYMLVNEGDIDLKISNPLYDRQEFRRFSSKDAEYALIVSRIDGPSLYWVKEFLNNSRKINSSLYLDGRFYLDMYSDEYDEHVDEYKNELTYFKEYILPGLYLDSFFTRDISSNPVFPFIRNDVFSWLWSTSDSNDSFFQHSSSLRTMFYNAGHDGANGVRDENSRKLVPLALRAGYANAAGSLSNGGVDSYLNPSSFFRALRRRASIGEAYLFSLPYFNWTVTLFGDPLTKVSFPPRENYDVEILDDGYLWQKTEKNIARSIAYLYKKNLTLKSLRDDIIDLTSNNRDFVLSKIYEVNDLYNEFDFEHRKMLFKDVLNSLFSYPEELYLYWGLDKRNPNINDFLIEKGYKVSRLSNSVYDDIKINEENLYDEGWWEIEHIIEDVYFGITNYHFKIEVSKDDTFNNIIKEFYSYQEGEWFYEVEKSIFTKMSPFGVPSKYANRKIRFESSESDYLERGKEYYFRVKQFDAMDENYVNYGVVNEFLSEEVYKDIIYT